MTAFFYTHLIEVESVISELDKLDLTPEQKVHLTSLIDSSLHHTILDALLSELTPEDKRVFLSHLTEGEHSKIWKFLNSRVDNIEGIIKKAAEDLKTELKKDLKEARQGRGSQEATKKK